jgi:2-methylcitrate dehydratase PrpD
VTSTVGAFGAAAAAGKLLGLDVQQMTNALGIAGTEAGGLTHYVPHGIGTADNPLTDEQLARKLHSLAEPTMGAGRTDELLATLDRLERLPSLAELARLLERSSA